MDPTVPAGAMQCMNCPSVGDGQSNRDGRKIVVTSLEIKGFVQIPAQVNGAAGSHPNPVSIWIALVVDTQTNGVQMNSEDCYVYNNVVVQADAAQPFKNLLYGGRFKTLRMWQITVNDRINVVESDNTVDTQAYRRGFHYYKKVKIPVDFNAGTTSDVANIVDNSIHLLCAASGPVHGATNPSITYSGRIRFIG